MPVSYEMDTLVTGMIANQRRQDVIAHNLANVNTVGYKKDRTVNRAFDQFLTQETDYERGKKKLHDQIFYSELNASTPLFVHEVVTNHEQGTMRMTENPFDLCLQGKGFFAIETPDGVQYTRKGAFMLNNNNELVTTEGYRVLGESTTEPDGEPLVIDGANVAFLKDGSIQADGAPIGKLQIVDFAGYENLKKVGNSFYRFHGTDAQKSMSKGSTVEQGYLEGSNVTAVTEMTKMVANTNHYELAGSALKGIEQTINRSIAELGKFK